jgi:hypothetical protein
MKEYTCTKHDYTCKEKRVTRYEQTGLVPGYRV